MSLTVADIMTREVRTLTPNQTLLDAMRFMREHHVRHIPIAEAERLVGLVTDRDIKRATPSAMLSQRDAFEKTLRETALGDIMVRNVIDVPSATPLRKVLELFVEEKISSVPVVDEHKLVGIVTAHDVFQAMLQFLPQ